MFRLRFSILAIMALCLATPGVAQQNIVQIPVTDKFYEGRVTYRESIGDILFRWTAVAIKEVPYVCIAVTNSHARVSRHNRTVMGRAKVFVDDDLRMRGLRFAKYYKPNTDLVGQVANCKPVPGGVPSDSQIQIQIGGGKVRG